MCGPLILPSAALRPRPNWLPVGLSHAAQLRRCRRKKWNEGSLGGERERGGWQSGGGGVGDGSKCERGGTTVHLHALRRGIMRSRDYRGGARAPPEATASPNGKQRRESTG